MREVKLLSGAHKSRYNERGEMTVCVNEYIAYLAGAEHSDQPKCVSPVLQRFTISLNDNLPDDERQRLRPYAVRMIGTAGDGQDERRSYMALDWLIRTYTPAFLVAAGLTEEAAKLKGLHEIRSLDDCARAEPECTAAWSAARAAAESAARAAAWSAAWSALEPTVVMCRESAFELLDRLIDPDGIHDISELPKTEEIERELAFLGRR
jgi:hypothetical protein